VLADLVVVVGVLAFFAIATLFVAGCDLIIGSEEPTVSGGAVESTGDERASTAGAAR
jgi:hypothetical protein